MIGVIDGFEWDDGNTQKCQKHGLSLNEIEAVFRHPHRIAPDIAHSTAEMRFLAIGGSNGPRSIFVVFTIREIDGERLIRPISARYMHRKEISSYEEDTSNPDH
ncbi:BrnT family toxin [Novosphingobium sp.]|uniref:BrnT family toxin n=1 Tax=Novosphingobium sp. TaxID=1874826 RepID=UPI0033410853